jgi:hypothetical protein
MNAAVQQIATQPGNQPVAAITFIAGRIAAKRRISTQAGPLVLTLVTMPAADEYSSPSTVEIRSKAAFGESGETVRVKCRVGGRARSYKGTDPETGEIRPVRTAEITLELIEG